jgi:hypothetical protein
MSLPDVYGYPVPPGPPPPTTKISMLRLPPATVNVPDEENVWSTDPPVEEIVPPVAEKLLLP